ILSGGIEHRGVSVLPGIPVQHVHHLPADAVHDVALSGLRILVEFAVLAVELRRQTLALHLQPLLLLVAQGDRSRGEFLPHFVDLLVEVFQFVLPGRKLRLQFSGCLLAFGGGGNRQPYVDHSHFCPAGGARRRGPLRPDSRRSQQASNTQRSRANHVSRIHCILLVFLRAAHPFPRLGGEECQPFAFLTVDRSQSLLIPTERRQSSCLRVLPGFHPCSRHHCCLEETWSHFTNTKV